jgi:hypothetical protein
MFKTFWVLIISFLSWIEFSQAAISAKQYGTVLNLSGKQRMLSQKMSKEVVLVALNVEKAANLKNLDSTSKLFAKTIIGLRDGDASLGLPATESKRILRQIGKIIKIWTPFYAKIQDIIKSKAVSKEQIDFIASNSLPLLKQMNKCVKLYEKEAAKSGLKSDPGLAVSINLSGKQRMLTQKMSKEFFLIAYGYKVKDNQLNLVETSQLFDRTLKGLMVGDKVLDLPPTTNEAILQQLKVVSKLWKPFKASIDYATSHDKIPMDKVKQIAKDNMPLLKEMNKAVDMYAQEAGKK